MRIFVINLEKDREKLETFRSNFDKFGLEYEVIKGVYGKELSQSELNQKVYDYKNSFMTSGEIGCALSHQKIYEKMVDEDISHALILEDDAIFSSEFLRYFSAIDKFLNEKISLKPDFELVIPFYKMGRLSNFKIEVDNDITLYKFIEGTGTFGYIITKNASKKMIKMNKPLILEADCWVQLQKLSGLKIYCLDKNIISTNDPDGTNSSIEKVRHELGKKKSRARKNRLRKMGGVRYILGGFVYRYYKNRYKKFIASGDNGINLD